MKATYQAIFLYDQMQCLAQNQCDLSMFFHNLQFHSPISVETNHSQFHVYNTVLKSFNVSHHYDHQQDENGPDRL